MRVATVPRRAATGLALIALVLALLPAAPAAAVGGYDAAYFSESAFPTLAPGQGAQLAVGFNNTGTTSWQKGTGTQINLAVCSPDKVTCNVTSVNAAFADGWFSNIAYATMSIDVVAPGQTGYFIYNVKAPGGAAAGTYRFNGELVLGLTGDKIHAVGYYQDVQVIQSNVTSISIAPSQATLNPGQQVQFTATARDSSGTIVNVQPGWSATGGTVSNTGLYTAGAAAGSFTVTAALGTASASASIAIFVPGQLNLALTQPGTYTLVLMSGVPLDPATIVSTNFSWDSAAFPTTPTQNTGGSTCTATGSNCREVRLDFNGTTLPVSGVHTLDVFNVRDMNGIVISPNPTSFRVTIAGDTTHPKVQGVTVVDNQTLDVDFSESMKTSTQFASTNAIDNLTNYRLLNRDGSPATTTGQSASGGTIGLSAATFGGTSTTDQIFNLTRVRLGLSAAMGSGVFYYLLPTNVADEASNLIDPNPTAVLFVNSTNTTRPTATAIAGSDQNSIKITFSKPMSHQVTAGATAASCSGSGGQIDNRANYTSFLSDNVTLSALGTSINAATTCFVSTDEQSVTIAWDPVNAVQPGVYDLKITGAADRTSNVINPNPTDINVSFTDVTAPTITTVSFGGSSSFTVTYSETVRGGVSQPDSGGNPANYSVNTLPFGNLCNGTTTISASNNGKTWIVTCGGSGTWGAQNTNTLHVHNVQDLAGNVINPSTAKPF